MGGASLSAFIAASALLAVTPGPGVLYIVTRTLAQGRSAGLASVAGVACGNFLNSAGASLGLAMLFAAWSGAFLIVKVAGAGYLVWLGVRMWRRCTAQEASSLASLGKVPIGRLWADGLAVALLNPKTALFFAAFLPQFMDARQPALGQALPLGALFVLIAASTDAAYAFAAAAVGPRLASGRAAAIAGPRAGGAALVLLGVMTLSTGPRRPV